MFTRIMEYFWFLGVLGYKQAKHTTKLYIYKNLAVAGSILLVVLCGLLLPWWAGPALVVAGLLGVLMIYRVWIGVGAADILQELVPEKKKDEIITGKYVAMAAAVILFVISPLVIPLLWPVQVVVHADEFHLVLLLWIVLGFGSMSKTSGGTVKTVVMWVAGLTTISILFLKWGLPTHLALGANAFNDTIKLGVGYYPSKPGKQVVRNKVRDWAYDRSKEDAAGAKPQTYDQLINSVDTAAEHANLAEEAERRGLAKAEGRTLPTTGIWVPAIQAAWMLARNERNQPIEVTRGEVITGAGEVKNFYVPHTIGPEGIAMVPDEINNYIPIARNALCPAFSLCGMVVQKNGRQQLFLIGEQSVAPASGTLYLVVNVPFVGPYGPDQDMFIKWSSGGFRVNGQSFSPVPQTLAAPPPKPTPTTKPIQVRQEENNQSASRSLRPVLKLVRHEETP